MPIYEFHCASCSEDFEELVRGAEQPRCPSCGAAEVERLLSQFAPPPKLGLTGAPARRSDSARRAREERRREEFARKREERRQEPSETGK